MTFYGTPQSYYEQPDPVFYRCAISGESSEDCQECIDDEHDGEPDYEDEEPADFDDRRHGIDDHLDDYGNY